MTALQIQHNLDPRKFKWLWMKYVTGVNGAKHCTNCLRGTYSKLLSGHNVELAITPLLILDELPPGSFSAIYICGVIKKGYPRTNYSHNLHVAILPEVGIQDCFEFEHWRMQIENGILMPIPAEENLPDCYRKLAPEFTTCRIFRWAVTSALNLNK